MSGLFGRLRGGSGPTPLWSAIEAFAEVFGPHGRIDSLTSKDAKVTAAVYETFEIQFGFEPKQGIFAVHLLTSPMLPMAPVEVWLATGSGIDEVRQKFVNIDAWCRLRLPADFVAELDRVAGVARAEGGV